MKVCSVCGRCYEDSVDSCHEKDHPPPIIVQRGSREMIAGYRLEFLLESGANSELYRARQTASNQSCRIKILAAGEKNYEQFLYEAKLAAALVHPNVVEVYETGVLENGEAFVVAEEAGGQTLRELLHETGAPPLVTTIQIARQTAEALHAVHQQGLTHRAVSPENIILTTDAQNRLLARIQNFDFGGVREQFVSSSRFLNESALNSLKYFAPEQCGSEEVNAQTDVYGLGVVFYEMLSGAPPFDAPTAAALIDKHKNQPPPEIKINNFDLRMLLTHTLMEALRKQPRMRHSSANVVARQLRHIEQLATHISTPPPAVAVKYAPRKSVAAPAKPLPIQPAALEAPEEIFSEKSELIVAKIEGEPIAAKVENDAAGAFKIEKVQAAAVAAENNSISVLAAESEPLVAFKVEIEPITELEAESEPIPAADLETAAPDLPEFKETAELTPANKSFEIFVDAEIRPATEMAEVESFQAESAESEIVQIGQAEISCAPADQEPAARTSEPPEEDIYVSETHSRKHLIESAAASGAKQFAAEDYSPAEDFSPQSDYLIDESFPAVTDEDGLLPALTRSKDRTLDSKDSIFSSYNDSPATRFPVGRRSLFIGGGSLGLLVLFLVGYALLDGRVNLAGADETVTAKTAPAQKSLPPQFEPANDVSPARQSSLKNVENPLPGEFEDADVNQLKPLPADERPPLSRENPPVPAVKIGVRNQTPKTPAVSRSAEKPPLSLSEEKSFVPSTIVIFPDHGKIKSRVEPVKNPAAKKQASNSRQTDIFIRPRVVKNPEP